MFDSDSAEGALKCSGVGCGMWKSSVLLKTEGAVRSVPLGVC